MVRSRLISSELAVSLAIGLGNQTDGTVIPVETSQCYDVWDKCGLSIIRVRRHKNIYLRFIRSITRPGRRRKCSRSVGSKCIGVLRGGDHHKPRGNYPGRFLGRDCSTATGIGGTVRYQLTLGCFRLHYRYLGMYLGDNPWWREDLLGTGRRRWSRSTLWALESSREPRKVSTFLCAHVPSVIIPDYDLLTCLPPLNTVLP